MIDSFDKLHEYLLCDSKNYEPFIGNSLVDWAKRFNTIIFSTPIGEQRHIWNYIKEMRYVEYYDYMSRLNKLYKIPLLYHLHFLRKESHITGFQIPPHTCGKGLTIWHWGAIIVNGEARLGENCTLYPGVLIGHKTPGGGAAIIGNNVFIGAGAKIIGNVKIGDNVTIGQNCVIIKDIACNSKVVVNSNRLI